MRSIFLAWCEHDESDNVSRVEASTPEEAASIYNNTCGELGPHHVVYVLEDELAAPREYTFNYLQQVST